MLPRLPNAAKPTRSAQRAALMVDVEKVIQQAQTLGYVGFFGSLQQRTLVQHTQIELAGHRCVPEDNSVSRVWRDRAGARTGEASCRRAGTRQAGQDIVAQKFAPHSTQEVHRLAPLSHKVWANRSEHPHELDAVSGRHADRHAHHHRPHVVPFASPIQAHSQLRITEPTRSKHREPDFATGRSGTVRGSGK